MAVASEYVLHGIGHSSTFISQITNARPSPRLEHILGVPSGLPFPTFVGNMQQRPEKRFETLQLKTVLDSAGMTMADWSAANTDLLYRKVTPYGTRDSLASTTANRLRASVAGLVIHRVSARQGGLATADCCLYLPYDGTNAPIVPAGSIAVSGTPSSAEQFTLGPVFLNGTQVFGIQDVSIDFGQQLIQTMSDGELYTTFLAVGELRPTVTIRCMDFNWSTFGLNGLVSTSGSFYLRKLATVDRVANGTASHIKFACTSGLMFIEETGGGGNDSAVTTIRIVPISADGTTLPLTVNTATAITS